MQHKQYRLGEPLRRDLQSWFDRLRLPILAAEVVAVRLLSHPKDVLREAYG